MLNLYQYRFKTFVVTKDETRILVANDTQQLLLLTEKEATEDYTKSYKEYNFAGNGCYNTFKVWNYYYWHTWDGRSIRVRIKDYDHCELVRTCEPVTATVYEIIKRVEDVKRVWQYFNECGMRNIQINI